MPETKNFRAFLPVAALVLWAAFTLHDYGRRGLYPPHVDQIEYLNQARIFAEHFLFYARGPLYAAWLGLHWLLTGGNTELTFYLEKISSILILAGLVGWLGWRLWGWPAAMLMAAWILNSETLLRETVNNHALAASLFTIALLCAASPKGTRRIPFGLLALFLATQARYEMWIPLNAAVISVAAWKLWRRRSLKIAPARDWIAAIAIGVLIGGVIAIRHGPSFPFRKNMAFGQTFAVSYVERHGLHAQYPKPWLMFHRVFRDHLPALAPYSKMNPSTALEHYPSELRGHILYNLRLALRSVPGVPLRVKHPILMALFVIAYVWTLRCSGRDQWSQLDPDRRRLILIWAALGILIVPGLLLGRPNSRYLMALLAGGIVWTVWLLRTIRCRFEVASRADASSDPAPGGDL